MTRLTTPTTLFAIAAAGLLALPAAALADGDRHDRGDRRHFSSRGGLKIKIGDTSVAIGGGYHTGHTKRHHVRHHHRSPQRVWVPGHFEYRSHQVLVERGHYASHHVPAQYRTVYRHGCPVRVLVRPAHYTRIWVPDRYETVSKRVWVPGYWQTTVHRGGHDTPHSGSAYCRR